MLRAVSLTKDMPLRWRVRGAGEWGSGAWSLRWQDARWVVNDATGDVFASAHASVAVHPAAVCLGEWSPDTFVFDPTSEDGHVYDLAELGLDFFVRRRTTHAFVYTDPTGALRHSGCKRGTVLRVPGLRWCPWCAQAFSANNFTAQHMRTKHPNVHLGCISREGVDAALEAVCQM